MNPGRKNHFAARLEWQECWGIQLKNRLGFKPEMPKKNRDLVKNEDDKRCWCPLSIYRLRPMISLREGPKNASRYYCDMPLNWPHFHVSKTKQRNQPLSIDYYHSNHTRHYSGVRVGPHLSIKLFIFALVEPNGSPKDRKWWDGINFAWPGGVYYSSTTSYLTFLQVRVSL